MLGSLQFAVVVCFFTNGVVRFGFSGWLVAFIFLSQEFPVSPKVTSNSLSSYFSILSARVKGVRQNKDT